MRALATPVRRRASDLVDTAGTGGGRPSFNVSTTAALIAAGAGCAMAKHGNRSATGLSGSADVLEALGVRIDLDAGAGRALPGRGRLRLHVRADPPRRDALRHPGAPLRSRSGRSSTSSGPLTNPAGARRQLIGVSDPAYLETMAGALAQLGVDRALVVSSTDGLDELSIAAPTRVVEVNGTDIELLHGQPRGRRVSDHARSAGHAGGEPGGQRGDHARHPRRRGRARARSRGAERGRRDLRGRRAPTTLAAGVAGRAGGDRRRVGGRDARAARRRDAASSQGLGA